VEQDEESQLQSFLRVLVNSALRILSTWRPKVTRLLQAGQCQ
jgi:hypothetical protein